MHPQCDLLGHFTTPRVSIYILLLTLQIPSFACNPSRTSSKVCNSLFDSRSPANLLLALLEFFLRGVQRRSLLELLETDLRDVNLLK